MASASAAADLDRLPWLTDEKRPASRRRMQPLLPAAIVSAVLVAAASYWLGMTTSGEPTQPEERTVSAPPSATARLPEIAPDPPRDAVRPVPAPIVQPMPSPTVEAAPPPVDRPEPVRRVRQSSAPRPAPVTVASSPPRLWPAWQSRGAAGRMVRIGTFSSSLQAKRAWGRIMRIYPGMRRLPAVVVSARSARDGRSYYRLQMGTSSQAHSEVLCQRMRIVGVNCVVVGLQPR